jgi:DnaJ-class molecular chaperone
MARNLCERCDGLGRMTAHSVPCTACGGSGDNGKYMERVREVLRNAVVPPAPEETKH